MKRTSAVAFLVSWALLWSLALARDARAVVADDVNDICAPDADPCLITQEYDVVDGTVLDFGSRAVEISGSGVIDTNAGEVTLFAGSVTSDAGTSLAFKVRGGNGSGQIDGGFLTVEARRACELDDTRPCTADANCDFGACTATVCAGETNRACMNDAACSFGTCNLETNACTGDEDRECTSDEECQVGPCSVDVCSLNRNLQCSSNADCDFGTCSVGDGSILLRRPVRADGATPGTVILRAAGDLTIEGDITTRATSADSDGGTIELAAGSGSVTVDGQLQANSGGFSTGGDIDIVAGQDITVIDPLLAQGGDFDGGFIELNAGRNVSVANVLDASSTNGGGFGGEITIFGTSDVSFSPPAMLLADGHQSLADLFGGDGGAIDISSDGSITANAMVIMRANGAAPDGFGGEAVFSSGADTTLAGTVEARTAGTATQGAGGIIDVSAEGNWTFPAGALLDVRGAANGGGAIFGLTGGGMTFGGTMDARAVNNGIGDGVNLDVNGDVTMTGTIRIAGTPSGALNGQVAFEFCRLTMNAGALIDNVGGFGTNTLRARERMTINSGATVRADAATGENNLVYRDPEKPPVIEGTITPAAEPDLDEFLAGCPVCGNGEIDGGETCEDGNTEDGDGCSAECQDEQCVAQTPGYPEVPLCEDDNGCTLDVCDNSVCNNIPSCDDNIDCTVDSCVEGECVHQPSNAACDDDNPCTDDLCSIGQHDCVHTSNVAACDDGLACTTGDTCLNGLCVGEDSCPEGQVCDAETGECTSGGGCGDGQVDGTDECDDGDLEWEPGEACDGTCLLLLCGDPDDSGTIRASDALFVLRVAVGGATCDPCVCNVDNSTTGNPVSASDALRVLRRAVSDVVELTCPICS